MSDAIDAVERAAYLLMTADPAPSAPVYQDVPDNAPPPVIIIGDVDWEPIGAKGDPDCTGRIEMVTVHDGDARKPLLAMQGEVFDRMADARIDVSGWRIFFTFTGGNAVLTPDGAGYVGMQNFTWLATKTA